MSRKRCPVTILIATGCLFLLPGIGRSLDTATSREPALQNLREVISWQDDPGQIHALQFHPGRPELLSFERRHRRRSTLWIADLSLDSPTMLMEVRASSNTSPVESQETESIGAWSRQLSWRTAQDGTGRSWFTFVANGLDGNDEIFLGSYPGGRIVRLTDDPAGDFMPVWNPVRDAIAFVSSRSGNADIYLIEDLDRLLEESSDGKRHPMPRRITQLPNDELHPAWSPDGRYLAYTSMEVGPHETALRLNDGISIIRVFPEVGQTFRITHDESRAEFLPSWSEDMNLIAYYVQNDEVYHDDESETDKETHLAVSIVTISEVSGEIIGGKRLRGVTRYLARSISPEQNGPVAWLAGNVPALLYISGSGDRGDLLWRGSVSRWLSPGSEFRTILEATPLLKTGLAVSPRGDVAIATVTGSRWSIQIGRIPVSVAVLSGEHAIEAETALLVPSDDEIGGPWDLARLYKGAVVAGTLVIGIIIGGIVF